MPVAPSPGAPNILLISIDSLRRDHLGCYGYARPTSPRLDQLSREGTRFQTVVAPTTWTLPSHVTPLTALPPELHGVIVPTAQISSSTVSLAQVLQASGYETAAFVSAPFLDAGYGFSRGFDLYDDYTAVAGNKPQAHRAVNSPKLQRAFARWFEGWIERASPRPFFAFVHMWDPHLDYDPPPPFDTLFSPDEARAESLSARTAVAVAPGVLARDIALYDGEIRYTDLHVGMMIDLLESHGQLDRTLIVVTSDHGDEFYEHGQTGHRKNLYDETLLVPLLLRYPPAVPSGHLVEQQVRLMDVAPTILGLARVTTPPTFGTAAPTPFPAMDLSMHFVDSLGASRSSPPAFADLNGEQAVVRTSLTKTHAWLHPLRDVEHYDLFADPEERRNLWEVDSAVGTSQLQVLRD
ncbi:MAG: sulfatase [Candidatus Eisenbacteria bacterium]|nr:sulfatase [Candidatus Eisenbacteria bacterium]